MVAFATALVTDCTVSLTDLTTPFLSAMLNKQNGSVAMC
jgi:hypothetical protein